jgi:hypothetical protein
MQGRSVSQAQGDAMHLPAGRTAREAKHDDALHDNIRPERFAAERQRERRAAGGLGGRAAEPAACKGEAAVQGGPALEGKAAAVVQVQLALRAAIRVQRDDLRRVYAEYKQTESLLSRCVVCDIIVGDTTGSYVCFNLSAIGLTHGHTGRPGDMTVS